MGSVGIVHAQLLSCVWGLRHIRPCMGWRGYSGRVQQAGWQTGQSCPDPSLCPANSCSSPALAQITSTALIHIAPYILSVDRVQFTLNRSRPAGLSHLILSGARDDVSRIIKKCSHLAPRAVPYDLQVAAGWRDQRIDGGWCCGFCRLGRDSPAQRTAMDALRVHVSPGCLRGSQHPHTGRNVCKQCHCWCKVSLPLSTV